MSLISSNYDIIFFGVIAFSATLAFIRGGIVEILSLSTWFIAFWVLRKFGPYIEKYLTSIADELLKSIATFIIIFLLTAIVMALVKKISANFIRTIGLGGLNYIIGIGFGVIRGVLICSLLIIVIQMLSLDNSKSYTQAKLYPVLLPVITWIIDAVPHDKKDIPMPPNNIMDLYK